MRLSEKTHELNICAEIAAEYEGALWIGPTTHQEKEWGFDAARAIGGRLFLFQFKAADYQRTKRRLRFSLPHPQLTRLQEVATEESMPTYYAFPLLHDMRQLRGVPRQLETMRFLDVSSLPNLSAPLIKAPHVNHGKPRKSESHYAYIYDEDPSVVCLDTGPTEAALMRWETLKSELEDPKKGYVFGGSLSRKRVGNGEMQLPLFADEVFPLERSDAAGAGATRPSSSGPTFLLMRTAFL